MTALNLQIKGSQHRDVVVVGAGLIGLSLALELNDRGANVTVLDRWRSLTGASIAAAGMLAAEDPFNPPELLPLSRLSIERYPGFLRRIEALSGMEVPFQTKSTLQSMADGSTIHMAERSIDPRQLAAALRAAVTSTSIELIEETQIASVDDCGRETNIYLESGVTITARSVVFAAGAWTTEAMMTFGDEPVRVAPRKGQMLRVRVPSGLALDEVHRNEHVYIVPRTHGPQAGTTLIGATVENAGFDTTMYEEALNVLRARAAELIPALGSTVDAPMVESWAGLRPAAPDLLPALGACAEGRSREGHFVASGHYRNGILLAPATAAVISDLLEGKAPSVDLAAFSPLRFSAPVSV